MKAMQYFMVGASAVTLMVSAAGFYKTFETRAIVSLNKETAERNMKEVEQQRVGVKSKLEECLTSYNSEKCNQLYSLHYNRLNEYYSVFEKFSQEADESLMTNDILLTVLSVNSAFGFLGMAYAFKRKEDNKNQSKGEQ